MTGERQPATVIGLDLGTTNAKAIALSLDGQVLATASSSGYAIRAPHPGWAEQDPEEVWRGAAAALRALAGKISLADVVGLSFSGAMHSCFPLGADDTPLAPALTWADQRAAQIAARLRATANLNAIYQRTGCPLQPIYHIAKLRWWRESEPEISRQAALFVTLKDYVQFKLTGVWAADMSIYSATGLLDIHRCQWDDEALSLAGITPAQLPTLVSPLAVVGHLLENAASITNLPTGLPIVAGASDGGLANLGSGASRPGQSVVTVGTSGAVRRLVAKPYLDHSQEGNARTWCYLLAEDRYFAGGAINNAGLAVQWVREKFYPDLAPEAAYQQLFADAAEIDPGAGGVMVLPFFAGERSPYWRADAKAAILGLGLSHDRRHISRATLEAVAFRLGTIWSALGAFPEDSGTIHLTGGILQSPLWAQIVCDVLGVPLAAVESSDASAVGAAMLGQVALGLAPSLDGLAVRIQRGASWQPVPARHARYSELLEQFSDFYRKLYG